MVSTRCELTRDISYNVHVDTCIYCYMLRADVLEKFVCSAQPSSRETRVEEERSNRALHHTSLSAHSQELRWLRLGSSFLLRNTAMARLRRHVLMQLFLAVVEHTGERQRG